MFSKLWCARVCYAIFLGSKNATLHSKIEHTANHFTVIQTLRVSKSTFSLIEIILKVHIHLSMAHRVSRMQNQEIKSFSTTYPSPIVPHFQKFLLSFDPLGITFSKSDFGSFHVEPRANSGANFIKKA